MNKFTRYLSSTAAVICMIIGTAFTVNAAQLQKAETKAAETKAAETKPAESGIGFNDYVSTELQNAKWGTELDFDIYYIEPVFHIGKRPVRRSVKELSEELYACAAALDPEKKQIIPVVIKGSDYNEYISQKGINLDSKNYRKPAKLKGKVVYSDDYESDLQEKTGSVKVLEFTSLKEAEQVVDEKSAVMFGSSTKVGAEAYAENIRKMKYVDFSYTVIRLEDLVTENRLDYFIFEATLDDAKASKVFIAIKPDDFVKDLDPGLKYEFETMGLIPHLKAEFKEYKFNSDPITVYGFSEDPELLKEGLTKKTDKKILIYHHKRNN